MDKSIINLLVLQHSPRFKPWAGFKPWAMDYNITHGFIRGAMITAKNQNRFNGLIKRTKQ